MSNNNTADVSKETKTKKSPKKVVKTIFDGFAMGIANVIPGVSGGTIALVLGFYEDFIHSITHIKKEFKKSMKFLLPLIVGVAIAFLAMSRVVTYCLENFIFATVMLFFGAVLGGLPMIFKKVHAEKTTFSDIIVCLLMAAIVMILLVLPASSSSVDLVHLTVGKEIVALLVCIISAGFMVVPGVSGSAFLMTVGYYDGIMGGIGDLTRSGAAKGPAVIISLTYVIGAIIGIFVFSKGIEVLLKKFEHKSYWGIIGFIIASAAVIIIQNFFMMDHTWVSPAVTLGGTSVWEFIIGAVLCCLGFLGSWKLDKD